MIFLLVLQWDVVSSDDFESLLEIEDALISILHDGSEVDGHDVGVGEGNIFIFTETPDSTFSLAMKGLQEMGMSGPRAAAYRPTDSDLYVSVWPSSAYSFSLK